MTFDEYRKIQLEKLAEDDKLDEGILDILNTLNTDPDIVTIGSCVGHTRLTRAYISFVVRSSKMCEPLLNIHIMEQLLEDSLLSAVEIQVTNFSWSKLDSVRYVVRITTNRLPLAERLDTLKYETANVVNLLHREKEEK